MSKKNYTPVDDLLLKNKAVSISHGLAKESQPASLIKEGLEIKEVVEHKAEEEIKPYVQTRAESIELPPDLKKMGLQSSSSTQFPTYQNVKLPISDDKIIVGLHAPVSTSLRWLAELARYILLQAHLSLKVIHGKVVRIIRT